MREKIAGTRPVSGSGQSSAGEGALRTATLLLPPSPPSPLISSALPHLSQVTQDPIMYLDRYIFKVDQDRVQFFYHRLHILSVACLGTRVNLLYVPLCFHPAALDVPTVYLGTHRNCWKQPTWETRPWATANVRDSYSVWWAHQPQKSTSVLLLFLVVSGMAASLCSLNLLEAAPNVCTVTCAACCSQFGIGACLHLNSIPHALALSCLSHLLVFLLLNSWLELQYCSNT